MQITRACGNTGGTSCTAADRTGSSVVGAARAAAGSAQNSCESGQRGDGGAVGGQVPDLHLRGAVVV